MVTPMVGCIYDTDAVVPEYLLSPTTIEYVKSKESMIFPL